MSVLPEHLGDRAGVRTAAREHGLREIKRRLYKGSMSQIILEDFNLEAAERRLCLEALTRAGNIIGAAKLLGITRHAMKRRIIKLRLEWPRR